MWYFCLLITHKHTIITKFPKNSFTDFYLDSVKFLWVKNTLKPKFWISKDWFHSTSYWATGVLLITHDVYVCISKSKEVCVDPSCFPLHVFCVLWGSWCFPTRHSHLPISPPESSCCCSVRTSNHGLHCVSSTKAEQVDLSIRWWWRCYSGPSFQSLFPSYLLIISLLLFLFKHHTIL